LDLDVEPSTLIPRPEISELVEWVMQIVGDSANLKIMDIGTGSGCIAIAIKRRCPQFMVMALDISAQALQVAQRNAARYGVDIIWQEKDVLTSPLEQVDVIVSNPPYICDRERTNMDARVLDYEPATALFVPDDDPLLFYRRIAEQHAARMLFFEINEEYGQEVCEMLSDLGYIDVIERTDIYGKTRMVFGRIAE
jgi:release factor glutamine methyltransferase